ncbi:HAD-IA family hydrolase [Ancylobacter rudongensis]|uniref:Phosphoglycolate phosphatase n=1 Tax=Ancylobacter rudongensis TaxID=177413 RepID=A0A1G4TKM4_9HYPH|nr:HAD-IA family hydrolase [Ancylobacter rudongensis]SCW81980.1 phosphoglycolate phosphatase [Ancylobacter rudongensis]
MPSSPPAVIAFDLDGTLVDTAPDLLDTLDIVLDEAGAARLPRDETRKMIGAGAKALVNRGLTAAGISVEPAEFDALYARFLEHYAAHIADLSRPYPGLLDALDELSARGHVLAVCTNKLEYLSRLLLDRLDLTDRFAVIAGSDTFPVYKPDAGHLLGTIERAGGVHTRAIMVGDSMTDVLTARNARVPSIVVPFGYTEIPAQELGGDVFIGHYELLVETVEQLLSRG